MAEPKGHYEKKGDVEEWVWDQEPGSLTVQAGWVVPEGEFDSRAVVDTRNASEKLAEEAARPGFRTAEAEESKKVTTKTAEPLTKKK